jgi:SNF2 family DNA or RNA helicase
LYLFEYSSFFVVKRHEEYEQEKDKFEKNENKIDNIKVVILNKLDETKENLQNKFRKMKQKLKFSDEPSSPTPRRSRSLSVTSTGNTLIL